MNKWGSHTYGDPCHECSYRWSLSQAEAIAVVAGVPDRYSTRTWTSSLHAPTRPASLQEGPLRPARVAESAGSMRTGSRPTPSLLHGFLGPESQHPGHNRVTMLVDGVEHQARRAERSQEFSEGDMPRADTLPQA